MQNNLFEKIDILYIPVDSLVDSDLTITDVFTFSTLHTLTKETYLLDVKTDNSFEEEFVAPFLSITAKEVISSVSKLDKLCYIKTRRTIYLEPSREIFLNYTKTQLMKRYKNLLSYHFQFTSLLDSADKPDCPWQDGKTLYNDVLTENGVIWPTELTLPSAYLTYRNKLDLIEILILGIIFSFSSSSRSCNLSDEQIAALTGFRFVNN